MEVFKDSLESIRSNPKMLDNIITQDDSWVYGYDLEKNSNVCSEKSLRSLYHKVRWCTMMLPNISEAITYTIRR